MKLEYVDINNIPKRKRGAKPGELSKLIKNFLDSGKAAAKVDYTDLYKTEQSFAASAGVILRRLGNPAFVTIRDKEVYIIRREGESEEC
jgi:hypothetical protein